MWFQVVEKLTKALLLVHKVCSQGHDVVFSERKGNYMMVGGDPNNKNPLRASGGTYELDVCVQPSNDGSGKIQSGFPRPVQKP